MRVLVVVAVAALGLLVAPRAVAGCHAFTVEASPATVQEGGTVTVTVTRDAAFNPSSVKVTSIDETATAGPDYPKVDRTISFTTDVEQSFDVAITQDEDDEGNETFRLHLSDAGGCAVNPNFTFGPDARVTIEDDDEPATTTIAPPTTAAPTTTARDGTTTTAGDGTTTTVEPGDAPDVPTTDTSDATEDDTTTTSEEELAVDDIADDDDDDDVSGLIVAIAVVAALAAGVGGYLIYRRRSPAA